MPRLQDPCPRTNYYFNLLWKYNMYLIGKHMANNKNATLLSGYEVNESVALVYNKTFENCFENGKTTTGQIYFDACLIVENERLNNGQLSDKLQTSINGIILETM